MNKDLTIDLQLYAASLLSGLSIALGAEYWLSHQVSASAAPPSMTTQTIILGKPQQCQRARRTSNVRHTQLKFVLYGINVWTASDPKAHKFAGCSCRHVQGVASDSVPILTYM